MALKAPAYDWSFFKGHVFCINLEERPDRLEQVTKTLNEIGLLPYVEFYHPTRSKISGAVGCYISHVTVLKMAKERGLKWCLILEDDLVFDIERVNNYLTMVTRSLSDFIVKVPWEIIFLGCSPLYGWNVHYKDADFMIYQIQATQAHAYLANLETPIFEDLLSRPIPEKDELNFGYSIYHIDIIYRDQMKKKYAIYPLLVFQNTDSQSDNSWGIGEIVRFSGTQEFVRAQEQSVVRIMVPFQMFFKNFGERISSSFKNLFNIHHRHDFRDNYLKFQES
jgi:hypothetical protein